ncbi:hypothetical protein I4U23_017374 [Adineta vaga]|nr:hypothetical protein I4U23_017374 [Adineta vaga]
MSVEVGQQAPDFILYNTELKQISLKELIKKSNVVILFFPFAFTSVCTTEVCSTRDEISIYEDLNATVIGISVDSPFCLAKFREENQLPFDLLSDFNKEVARKYDSLYDELSLGFTGVTKRSAFIIDKQGHIKYAEILEDSGLLPSFDKMKEVLQNCN